MSDFPLIKNKKATVRYPANNCKTYLFNFGIHLNQSIAMANWLTAAVLISVLKITFKRIPTSKPISLPIQITIPRLPGDGYYKKKHITLRQ